MTLAINNSISVFGTKPSFGNAVAPGTNTDYAVIDPYHQYDLTMGPNATLEAWWYIFDEGAARTLIQAADYTGTDTFGLFDITVGAAGVYLKYVDYSGVAHSCGGNISVSYEDWHHIAVEFVFDISTTTINLYIDGALDSSITGLAITDRIGGVGHRWFIFRGNGTAQGFDNAAASTEALVHDLRFTQYTAGLGPRYGGAFTPPAADFPTPTTFVRTVLHTGNYQNIIGNAPLTVSANWVFSGDVTFTGVTDIRKKFITDSSTARTLSATDAAKYIRFTSSSAINCTVPNDTTATIPPGSSIEVMQADVGAITFVMDSGVTAIYKGLPITAGKGSHITLVKTASNAWDIFGDLVVPISISGTAVITASTSVTSATEKNANGTAAVTASAAVTATGHQ